MKGGLEVGLGKARELDFHFKKLGKQICVHKLYEYQETTKSKKPLCRAEVSQSFFRKTSQHFKTAHGK